MSFAPVKSDPYRPRRVRRKRGGLWTDKDWDRIVDVATEEEKWVAVIRELNWLYYGCEKPAQEAK